MNDLNLSSLAFSILFSATVLAQVYSSLLVQASTPLRYGSDYVGLDATYDPRRK
ncbi:Hypothetical protein UVM_LOCUS146 [uncultured virus]|nr:Hypothetical protein UVM_LOCUS146 [uncultured virus]